MRRAALVLFLALGAGAPSASAHEFDPHVLRLAERGAGRLVLDWRSPLETSAEVVWPGSCEVSLISRSPLRRRFDVRCANDLGGQVLSVRGLPSPGDEVLLEWVRADGRRAQFLLRGESDELRLPRAEPGSAAAVASRYLALGVEHLLLGPDHLLFVIGLLVWMRQPRRLVAAVSAFTAGHALTLCLATLGVIRLAPAPVEACIALTLVWLARETMVGRAERWSGARAGWVPGGFGLLHGLGFAGALGALEVPAEQLPWALGAFNLGIELGQLLVLALGGLALAGLHLAWPALGRRWVPGWARITGAISMFWVIDRTAQVIS